MSAERSRAVPAHISEKLLYLCSSGACGRRASAPSSPPSTGAHGEPATHTSPQHGPARHSQASDLPARAWKGGSGELTGESSAGHRPRAFARRAWDPAPRHGPADLRWLVGMHTARPLSRAGKRFVQPRVTVHQFRGPFFPSSLDRRRSVSAAIQRSPFQGDALRAYRPASELVTWQPRARCASRAGQGRATVRSRAAIGRQGPGGRSRTRYLRRRQGR
jgi:hypothetical protein